MATVNGSDQHTVIPLLDRVAQRGSLRIACQWGHSAEQYLDREGRPAGIVVEMGRLMANDLGVEPEFVELRWADHLRALSEARVDVLMKHTNTPERAFVADFSRHVLLEYEGIVVVRAGDAARGATPLEDGSWRPGATSGSIHYDVIRRRFPRANVDTFPDAFAGMLAVKHHEIDAFATDQGLFDEAVELAGSCAVLRDNQGERLIVSRDASHPAIRVGDQGFLNWMDNWMDFHHRLGTIQHIIETSYVKRQEELDQA